MSNCEYTLKTTYELVLFGESLCEITFCYNPAIDDDTVEIQSARFYDHDCACWIDLGYETSLNLHRDIDEHLLEFGREKHLSDAQGCAEDRAYDEQRGMAA